MKRLFIILPIIAGIMFLGCEVKEPSTPDWYITLRAPVADTTLTMIDAINEKPEYLFSRSDSVFWGEDTILLDVPLSINFPVHVQFSHHLPEAVDTVNTNIQSYVTEIRAGGRFIGNVQRAINAYMYVRLTEREGVVREDTFDFNLPQGPVDTLIQFSYTDFPIGEFVMDITIDTTNGYAEFDTVHIFYEIPFSARFLGDTVLTVLEEIKVDSSLQEAAEEKRIKEIILHLDLWNRLPVGLSYSYSIFSMDTSREYKLFDNQVIQAAPTSHGLTTGPEVLSTIDFVANDSLFDFFKDSLVYYKAIVIVPPKQDTVVIKRDDYIRLRGTIQATIFTDFEGGE